MYFMMTQAFPHQNAWNKVTIKPHTNHNNLPISILIKYGVHKWRFTTSFHLALSLQGSAVWDFDPMQTGNDDAHISYFKKLIVEHCGHERGVLELRDQGTFSS